jgi:hypothetical protein
MATGFPWRRGSQSGRRDEVMAAGDHFSLDRSRQWVSLSRICGILARPFRGERVRVILVQVFQS